jgi:hypothetical protein
MKYITLKFWQANKRLHKDFRFSSHPLQTVMLKSACGEEAKLNKELTVLTILLLFILLDGVGAWHFLPDLRDKRGWSPEGTFAIIAALAGGCAVLVLFSFLIVKRIINRIF